MALARKLLVSGAGLCLKSPVGQLFPATERLCRPLSVRTKESVKSEFEKVLPLIIDEVIVGNPDIKDLPMVQSWYRQVFEYNLVGGKMTRGLQVVDSYYQMSGESKDDVFAAQIVGWCTEMLLSSLLIIDDMMDEAQTRRGHPCWYLREGVGTTAANDGLLVESSIYETLHKYLSEKPYYMDIVRLFEDVSHKTYLGQVLDMHGYVTDGKTDLNKVTLDLVSLIAKYKTAYCTVYIPVVAAMHMVGIGDPKFVSAASEILLDIGVYFQAQDDFIDCFSDPSVTGKVGTDIEDGKCTWLLANALEKGTKEQIEIIRENYGIKDPNCIATVKQMYREIGIPEIYEKYESDIQSRLAREVDELPSEIPRGPFMTMLNKLRGRRN